MPIAILLGTAYGEDVAEMRCEVASPKKRLLAFTQVCQAVSMLYALRTIIAALHSLTKRHNILHLHFSYRTFFKKL
jgi:hypothetical protein